MHLDIQAKPFSLTEALDDAIRSRAYAHLGRFDDLRHVQVRVYDINGPRGGADMACRIFSDMGRAKPLRVEVVHEDLYTAIAQAFDKAERTIEARLRKYRGRGRSANRFAEAVAAI